MAKITSNTVSQLLSAVGGSNNVSKCGNCMTRLRLSLATMAWLINQLSSKFPA